MIQLIWANFLQEQESRGPILYFLLSSKDKIRDVRLSPDIQICFASSTDNYQHTDHVL